MQIFTLARQAQTNLSTWGNLLDAGGNVLCKILERGAANPAHVRITAGLYEIGRKPVGSSIFDTDFSALIGPSYKGILWLPNVPGRSNIEIHTANYIEQLEGCLATGGSIIERASGDFMIAGGASKPAYARVYPIISLAIDNEGAQLRILDIPA